MTNPQFKYIPAPDAQQEITDSVVQDALLEACYAAAGNPSAMMKQLSGQAPVTLVLVETDGAIISVSHSSRDLPIDCPAGTNLADCMRPGDGPLIQWALDHAMAACSSIIFQTWGLVSGSRYVARVTPIRGAYLLVTLIDLTEWASCTIAESVAADFQRSERLTRERVSFVSLPPCMENLAPWQLEETQFRRRPMRWLRHAALAVSGAAMIAVCVMALAPNREMPVPIDARIPSEEPPSPAPSVPNNAEQAAPPRPVALRQTETAPDDTPADSDSELLAAAPAASPTGLVQTLAREKPTRDLDADGLFSSIGLSGETPRRTGASSGARTTSLNKIGAYRIAPLRVDPASQVSSPGAPIGASRAASSRLWGDAKVRPSAQQTPAWGGRGGLGNPTRMPNSTSVPRMLDYSGLRARPRTARPPRVRP